MKQLFFFCSIFFLGSSLLAQKTRENVLRDASGKTVEENIFPYVPNVICLDGPGSFINWQNAKPTDFSFELFNRWGELIASSEKHDFNFEELLTGEKKFALKEGTYVYRILFTLPNGKKRKIIGQGIYVGSSCNCG